MKQDNHPIDDLIRQRIQDLPPPPVRGWDELSSQLDERATDEVIAEKLSSLTPAAPAGGWEVLARKIDETLVADNDTLDRTVAAGLLRAEPSTVSGWSTLAARLEVIGKRREMVSCLKITEGALLLSMLLLFARFGEVDAPRSPAHLADARPPAKSFPVVVPELKPIDPPALHRLPSPRSGEGDAERRALPEVVPTLPRLDFSPALRRPIVTPDVRLLPSALAPLDLSISPLAQREILPRLALHFDAVPGSDPVHYYLNGFVSPVDLNEIVTQESKYLGIQAQRKISLGYSVGALIEVEQKGNAVQFGLIYGHRSYVPSKMQIIEEDTTGLKRAQDIRYSRLTYETVSIPLNYQRELTANDKWRLSAGLGMAMNIVLGADVRLPENVTLDDLNRLLREEAGLLGTPRDAKAQVQEILDPTQGYFQGGGILENSSLYLSGNLRVERLLGDRWSIYFSPTVGRLLTIREGDGGRGPLEDRIHNTMLRFGTRVRLSGY